MSRLFTICASLLITLVIFASPLSAQMLIPGTSSATQDAISLPDPLTPEAANALISRLSDTEVRGLLLDQLNTQASNAATTGDTSEFLHHITYGALQSVIVPIQTIPGLISGQARAISNFLESFGTAGILSFLALFALAIAIAATVEFVFRRVTARWHAMPDTLPDDDDPTLRETLSRLFQRFCHEMLAVAVFILVATSVSRLIMPPEMMVYASLIGPNLIGLPRVALAVGRFVMAPDFPAYRLVHATDESARASVFHMFGLALLIGFSAFIIGFNAANGLPIGELRLAFWLNLAVHIYIGIVIWRYRDEMVAMMRGPNEVTPMEDRVARAFPLFAIVVSAGTWWIVNTIVSYGNFALLSTSPHYKTMAVLLFAPAMDTAIRAAVRHLAPAMTGEGVVAERAHVASTRSFIRIGRVLVFGFVMMQVASFWGMNPQSIAAAGVGAQFAAAVIEFLIIMSIGYLCYEMVSLWINRKLAAEYTASGYDPDNADFGGDGGGAGGSRLSTVLPLVLLVSRTTIVIVFLLLGLGNIGVDTTPLLAGAGIVGLAIGFGAQKLVTDVVSGIFFLVDDAFRTGEYVTVEDTMGTVEKISIRSMQLRHHKGPVHTIPYGEIPKITNFSRDWVIMKLRFTVPFDTDPNKVKKIFKRIGQDLLAHEDLGPDFLQPFKSQGVLEIDDVGVVIRGKFMAKPGKQFMIRKEIFNRVSAEFAANGIEFARREVRVALPGHEKDEPLTPEDHQAIAAAASQSAQQQMAEGAAKDNR
ncbi:MAG: mechanosensitive ion channel domain-containing protein [Aliishimia sp.]